MKLMLIVILKPTEDKVSCILYVYKTLVRPQLEYAAPI